MRKFLSLFVAVGSTLSLFMAVTGFYPEPEFSREERQDITSCATSFTGSIADSNGKFIPALSGWGNHHHSIITRSDSAQYYFDQGLSFYFGYHFAEALASFREAARFDPASAMTYWGQALSMGPFYNTYIYKMNKDVPAALALMNQYAGTASDKEKDMMHALAQRYSNDMSNADRQQLNRAYALELSLLVKKYPDDHDIKALYIDAVMLEHKWDFWSHDGKAKPWTPELVSLCESIIKNDAHHPAALHYYIHLTEASRQPSLALAGADKLKDDMPGIGHMVHMSSHMYQRNGLFLKGVQVNDAAHEANNLLDAKAPALGVGKDKSIHFYSVQSYCAMQAGMYSKGLRVYDRARDRLLAGNPDFKKDAYAQFVYMIPVMARVRLGKWEEVMQSASPDMTWKYAVVLDNFAKGLANLHANNASAAKQNLINLELALKDSLLMIRQMPFNKPVNCGSVGAEILRGEILFEEGKLEESLAAFSLAVKLEDELIYREPNDWLIPARQFLGAYLLKVKQGSEAQKVYEEDLLVNPNNGWSLLGMTQALLMQKRLKEAEQYKLKSIAAFASSDVQAVASVF